MKSLAICFCALAVGPSAAPAPDRITCPQVMVYVADAAESRDMGLTQDVAVLALAVQVQTRSAKIDVRADCPMGVRIEHATIRDRQGCTARLPTRL